MKMILFKFLQKKIVLDCFTHLSYVVETAPIVPAIKLIPDWWKNLPNSYIPNDAIYEVGTMKHCVGMVEYYKNSIVIPLWSDLVIKFHRDGSYNWQFSDGQSKTVTNDIRKQATGFLNHYAHFKIESPWYLKTKEDINWVWTHPTYNYKNSNDIVSLPAIVNYKNYLATHINILIRDPKEKTILIPQGQPMVHIVPMSDRKIEIVRHLVSKEEYDRISASQSMITFTKKHKNLTNLKEKFKDCPYHK